MSAAHELPIEPRSTIVAIAMRHEEQCRPGPADRSLQAKAALRHAAVPVLVVVFERSSAAEFAAVVISVVMAARL